MSELHEAASVGDLDWLESALKKGANPNEPDSEWGGRTPLHVACSGGHKRCVQALLKGGADPNARTDCGWTPAHAACEAGHVSLVTDVSGRWYISPALTVAMPSAVVGRRL